VPLKQKVLCAVLAAVGLCLAAEAFCRHCPSLLPDRFNIFRVKHLLFGRFYVRDDDLYNVLAADFHQVFKWRGRKLEIRQMPFPGQSHAGYRVDSRNFGQPHADIVALGNSFTNAVEVDQDSTWASRLGAITGLQVANLGVPGYGTTQEAGLFRLYGSRLRPKLVVLLLDPNDPSRNMFFRSWRLSKSRRDPERDSEKRMFCLSTGLSGGLCRSMEFAARSGILPNLAVQWLFLTWKAMPLMTPEGADSGRQLMYEALEDLRSQAASRGAGFCVVINDYWESLFPKSFQELTAFLRREGIPYLNLSLHAKYRKVRMNFGIFEAHWNEEGHALAAAEMHRFLLRNELIPAGIARRH